MKTADDARKIGITFIYWRVKQYRDDENKVLLLKTTETKHKHVKIIALLNKHNENISLFIFPETTDAFCKEVEDD
jgi:hypothetical protein